MKDFAGFSASGQLLPLSRAADSSKIRQKLRGPLAWINAAGRNLVGATKQGKNPLLVNTVQGRTNLNRYLPLLSGFWAWMSFNGVSFSGAQQQDWAMADYLAVLAYMIDCDVATGKFVLAAFLHLYPEMHGSMPCAARCLTSWAKLRSVREREGICEEACWCMICDAIEEGEIWEALGYWMIWDAFFRGQDLFQMLYQDFLVASGSAGVTLGDPARGEQVKTGTDQGVVFEDPGLVKIVKHIAPFGAPGEKVFKVKSETFRRKFKRRLRRRKMPDTDGPHRLRHGSAANAIRRKTKTLEGIRRRGRWANIKNVQIYTREHLWLRNLSRMSPDDVDRGQFIMHNTDLLADIWLAIYEDGRQIGDDSYRAGRGRPATPAEQQRLTAPKAVDQSSETPNIFAV